MALYRTVAPEAEPLAVAECKAYLRIDHDDEDGLIAGLVRAARDVAERHAGLALIDQDWRLALDGWPPGGRVPIRLHPVREILSVTLFGEEGEATTLDPSRWRLDRHSRPARLDLSGPPWPGAATNGIEIDFRAGFGEAGTDVPDLLRRAMMLLVAHWYEFRAQWGPADQPVSIPAGFDRLMAGYRQGRLA